MCGAWFLVMLIEFASGEFVGSELSGFVEIVVKITGGSPSTPITTTVTLAGQSASGNCIINNIHLINVQHIK